MTLTTVLVVILIVLLVGSMPNWPYSRDWGYRPSTIAGALLLAVLVLILADRL